MSWSEVFLGVIAIATLVMALLQVALILYGWTLARKVSRLVDDFEREVKPAMESINSIARDAARATTLAAVQVERIDKLFGELSSKIEQTASAVQNTVITPLREGAAVMSGIRAAIAVLKEISRRSASSGARSDEEDALFIG